MPEFTAKCTTANRNFRAFQVPSTKQATMIDKVSYGPNGYEMHEESHAMENEYHNNYSSMQMMPPNYSKQHMTYCPGTHGGTYPDGGWNVEPKYHNGWSGPNMMHKNGYYSHPPGGKYTCMTGPMMAPGPGRMPPNNMMMNAEFETYQAGPGRMRMQNYAVQSESYDDYANGMHNGHQKVEWKNL